MSDKIFVPPSSVEAEESILGSIFLDPQLISEIISELRNEDFYYEKNRMIFGAIESLFERGEPVDVVTVIDKLRRSNLLGKVGGEEAIIEISQKTPTTANFMYYTRIVKEKSLLRNLIQASGEIVDAVRASGEPEDILDFAEKRIFSIAESRATKSYAQLSSVMHTVFSNIEYTRRMAANNGSAIVTGYSTGFRSLDRITAGLHKSDLIIIAARPAMGKSSFALNLATNLAIRGGAPVAMFSLEMSKEQLATRVLCSEANVGLQKVKNGTVSSEEWERLIHHAGQLSGTKIIFDDEAGLDPRLLRAKARRMKKEYGIEAILIDYIQLMTSRNTKGRQTNENRQQEISEISRSLKLLARELNIVVIALSQLSREVEKRDDKRPKLSDLRESGAIEQDADMVMFLYRDAYYKRKEEGEDIGSETELILNQPHETELIIGKQRSGPVGTVMLMFDPALTKFYDSDKIHNGYD